MRTAGGRRATRFLHRSGWLLLAALAVAMALLIAAPMLKLALTSIVTETGMGHLQDARSDCLNMARDTLLHCTLSSLEQTTTGAGVVEVELTLTRIPLGRTRQEARQGVQLDDIA